MSFDSSPLDYLGAFALAFAWGVATALAVLLAIVWGSRASKPFPL